MVQAGDFEAAVSWAVHHDDLDTAVDIVVELTDVGLLWGWVACSHWLDPLIEQPPTALPARWAELLVACAYRLENELGDFEESLRLGNAALELDPGEPAALMQQCLPAILRGDIDHMRRYATLALQAAQLRDKPLYELYTLMLLVSVSPAESTHNEPRSMRFESGRPRSVPSRSARSPKTSAAGSRSTPTRTAQASTSRTRSHWPSRPETRSRRSVLDGIWPGPSSTGTLGRPPKHSAISCYSSSTSACCTRPRSPARW